MSKYESLPLEGQYCQLKNFKSEIAMQFPPQLDTSCQIAQNNNLTLVKMRIDIFKIAPKSR